MNIKVINPLQQVRSMFLIVALSLVILNTGNARAIGTISLDQATLALGSSELSLSKIELSGADSSIDELKALFSATEPDEFQDRLKRFSAASLKIGEMKQTQRILGDVSTSITRNVEFTGIRDGIATLVRADGGVFGGTSSLGESHSGTFGPYSFADVDIPLIIRLGYGAKSQPSDTFKQAYSSATLERLVFSPATGPSGSIEKISLKNVGIKESESGFVSLAERIAKNSNRPEATDTEKTQLVLDFVTLLDSFSIGTLEVVGFSLKEPNNGDVSLNIGRILFSGASSETGASFKLEGLDITGADGHLQVGSLGQTGFKLDPTLKKLREQLSKPGAKVDDITARVAMPVLGRFELRDVSVEALMPEPIKAGVRSMVLAFDNPEGGIPIAMKLSVDGLFGPFPTDPNDELSQTMIGLGYRDFDLSGAAEFRWDPPPSDLSADVSLSGANIGSLHANLRLGGISQETLIGDPAAAAMAAMAATLKSATIEIENRGLAERLIDQDAIKTKRTPEQVKKGYASVAAASLQLYLGASETAMRLTRSIVRFVENPTKLSITAQSKDKNGVGMADTTLAEGPGAVIDLFDVTTSSD